MDNFIFHITDVFMITGRGVVVTGRVEKGNIRVRDSVLVSTKNGSYKTVTIIGIEQFRKSCDIASEGESCGIMLSGITKDDIKRDGILTTMGEMERTNYDPIKINDQEVIVKPVTRKLNGEDEQQNNKKWWQKLF